LVWDDADKYADDASPIVGSNIQFKLDVTDEADQHNLLKQCYVNLKTQEGFTDGVDA
jgi:hypothetical protein